MVEEKDESDEEGIEERAKEVSLIAKTILCILVRSPCRIPSDGVRLEHGLRILGQQEGQDFRYVHKVD
jgi:hypothetical protein